MSIQNTSQISFDITESWRADGVHFILIFLLGMAMVLLLYMLMEGACLITKEIKVTHQIKINSNNSPEENLVEIG